MGHKWIKYNCILTSDWVMGRRACYVLLDSQVLSVRPSPLLNYAPPSTLHPHSSWSRSHLAIAPHRSLTPHTHISIWLSALSLWSWVLVAVTEVALALRYLHTHHISSNVTAWSVHFDPGWGWERGQRGANAEEILAWAGNVAAVSCI